MTSRRAAAPVLAAVMALVLAPAAPRSSAAPRPKLAAAAGPVRLVPDGTSPTAVAGLNSYFGTIELDAAGDGLVVVNRLPLERYLLGLAEVPSDWPEEALRAQAIAARTYALWTLGQPRYGEAALYGFDICATVQCQVFSGAEVVTATGGARWAAAVRDTAGQAILYGGRPILARYHSVSGGATLDNPQAFPGERAYPYLQGVHSPTDAASPLFRWYVEFTLRDLQAILARAGWWSADEGRLVAARTVPSRARLHYPDVVLSGTTGRVRATAEQLREVVRDVAPAMFPAAYPSVAPTSSGRLPETFPSNRLRMMTRDERVVVVGRGWGHGVGMSQWGAYGLALEGATYPEILGHYYTGVELGTVPDPGPLEVGLASGLSRVSATGSFSIVDGNGRTLVRRALGTWTFSYGGTGAVSIDPPRGYGLPLEVGIVRAPRRVETGTPAYLTIALSRPAKVSTLTLSGKGFEDPGSLIRGAGRRRIPWLAPVEPGRYRIRVRASTGAVRRHSEVVEIVVREPSFEELADAGDREDTAASNPAVDSGAEGSSGARNALVLLGIVLVASVAAAAIAGTIKR